ncbi:MAG TPA: hypothetical protein PK095_20475 [Myxococcota bacterium]|nr:hypothetical protein [Myxococcota bacterium]
MSGLAVPTPPEEATLVVFDGPGDLSDGLIVGDALGASIELALAVLLVLALVAV